MSTQALDTITEEDTSYNAWNQFNEIRNSQIFDKPAYRVVNTEKEEEYDEETLIDSAWSKFCEIKTQNDKKTEYKRVLKEENTEEESDGAWKEFKKNTEDNNNSTEEDTVIEGAWKEFIENKDNSVKKSEYIKITEEDEDIDEISSEIEYEKSAWNNFKSIESEEKLKKNNQTISMDNRKKEERVKIQLADCAWNQFVVSDKNLFDKYQQSLERIEDDIIMNDDKSANSVVIEGEPVNIVDSVKKVEKEKLDQVKEEVQPVEEKIKVVEEVKEEVQPVEEVKEEIKEIVKEKVQPVEEVKEEIKETVQEEVQPVEKVKKSKKSKFSKLLKKAKKAIKKIFKKSKKNKN